MEKVHLSPFGVCVGKALQLSPSVFNKTIKFLVYNAKGLLSMGGCTHKNAASLHCIPGTIHLNIHTHLRAILEAISYVLLTRSIIFKKFLPWKSNEILKHIYSKWWGKSNIPSFPTRQKLKIIAWWWWGQFRSLPEEWSVEHITDFSAEGRGSHDRN